MPAERGITWMILSVGRPPIQASVAPMRRKPSAYGSPPATPGSPTRCATTSSRRIPAVKKPAAIPSRQTSRSASVRAKITGSPVVPEEEMVWTIAGSGTP